MTIGGTGGGFFNAEVEGLDELKQKLARVGEAMQRVVELAMLDVQSNIAQGPPSGAPVDHGRLAGSFVPFGGGYQWTLRSGVEYGVYVHEGTGVFGKRKRPIKAKSAKALRFEVGGKVLYRRSVKGSPPNPFGHRAIDKTRPRIEEFAVHALREIGLM